MHLNEERITAAAKQIARRGFHKQTDIAQIVSALLDEAAVDTVSGQLANVSFDSEGYAIPSFCEDLRGSLAINTGRAEMHPLHHLP